MSEMIERVANAIAAQYAPAVDQRAPYAKIMMLEAAKAAIEAIREDERAGAGGGGMSDQTEPDITINGVRLTTGEAMTIRVALSAFATDLKNENALGDDDHGHAMRDVYSMALRDIFALMAAGWSTP